MVELEDLSDPEEADFVQGMVLRHAELTGSRLAEQILNKWGDFLPRFVRVIPRDYKRMLVFIRQMENDGLGKEEAVLAAFDLNSRDLARIGGG
jgi:glutamate synthase (NADPH/NADH) large chain